MFSVTGSCSPTSTRWTRGNTRHQNLFAVRLQCSLLTHHVDLSDDLFSLSASKYCLYINLKSKITAFSFTIVLTADWTRVSLTWKMILEKSLSCSTSFQRFWFSCQELEVDVTAAGNFILDLRSWSLMERKTEKLELKKDLDSRFSSLFTQPVLRPALRQRVVICEHLVPHAASVFVAKCSFL